MSVFDAFLSVFAPAKGGHQPAAGAARPTPPTTGSGVRSRRAPLELPVVLIASGSWPVLTTPMVLHPGTDAGRCPHCGGAL